MIKALSKVRIKLKVISFIIFTLGMFGCNESKIPVVSFYYWKTIYTISENEKEILKENNVTKMYVRYFDVIIKDNLPIPSTLIFFRDLPSLKIVPVIYLKNDVLLLPNLDLNVLGNKILKLIEEISVANKIKYNEIQIDCDWTLKSKDNYLQLIDLLKSKSIKNISVTIRLHQIKYFKKTGVPYVERGVLMYYNMGKIGVDTLNSIYERETAMNYIQSLKNYPLPLNIALPIYSWAIHIRGNKVIGLINKVDRENFSTDSNYIQRGKNFFYVKNNNIKSGSFFEKGDKIKIESISSNSLEEMCEDLQRNINSTPNEIIFYDFDEFNFKNYNYEKKIFQKICDCF